MMENRTIAGGDSQAECEWQQRRTSSVCAAARGAGALGERLQGPRGLPQHGAGLVEAPHCPSVYYVILKSP
jgi:hypothetical protein